MKIQRLVTLPVILLVAGCVLAGFRASVFAQGAQADQIKFKAKNLKKKLESDSNGNSATNSIAKTNAPAVKPAK